MLLLIGCSGGGSGDRGGGGGGAGAAFALGVAPGTVQLTAGGGARVTVQVVPEAGFEQDVVLEVTGAPSGVGAVFARTPVRAGDVALDLSCAAGVGAGDHLLSIVATSGGLQRTTPLAVQIVDVGFDFGLEADLQALRIERAGTATTRVRFVPLLGLPPAPAWALEDLPVGMTGSVVAGASGDVLELQAAANVLPGSYDVTLAATAGALRRELRLLVHALPAAEASGLTLRAPHLVQVRRGATTAAQLEIARDAGITGAVALQLDGVPANVAGVFDDNPARGAGALLQLTAAPTAQLGEFLLTVTGTQGAARGTGHLLLQVVDAHPLADVRIQRVELAQAFFAEDPGLVANKPALLRAHVVADVAGVPAPVVRVTGSAAGATLGTLDLAGPTTLPVAEQPGNLAQSHRVELPATWIRPDLELALALDPGGSFSDREERNDRVRIAPRVGAENRIDVVVVPLRLAGREAQPSSYRDMLLAHWPLTDVTITVRATYDVTSVADVASDGTGWSSVLSEVRALRTADGSSAWYYGVVPVTYGSGVAGMGYVGLPVSIGWHRTSDVLVHELGHNFGLAHAPCGGASGPDQEYPFPNGIIGHQGFDRRTGTLVDPRSTVDLMSYCRPDWVSGYNHEKVRGRLGALAAHGGAGGRADVPLLVVRGRLTRDAVVLEDVRRVSGVPDGDVQGDLELRLTHGGGRVVRFPVGTAAIGCGADERHFLARVPEPLGLEVLELVRGDRVLVRRTSGRAALPPGVAAAHAGLGLVVEERAQALHLRWDHEAWPVVGVVHVGARRTALALALRGGRAELPLAGLPPGGQFEVSAIDGIDGFALRVAR